MEKSVQANRLVQHTIQSSHIRDEVEKKFKAEE
jgi:hypothetical protein